MVSNSSVLISALLGMLMASEGSSSIRYPELGWDVYDSHSKPFVLLADETRLSLHPVTSLFEGQEMRRVMFAGGTYGYAYGLAIDEVQYTVAFDDSASPRLFFIETYDVTFRTPEGVRVGMTYEKLATVKGAQPPTPRGWGCTVCLGSGWSAVLSTREPCRKRNLRSGKVEWLFRSIDSCED